MPRTSPAGLYYEVMVGNWLQRQGYKTRFRQRSRAVGEADIVATKGRVFKETLFVECKDKEVVSLLDFHRFVSKFKRFRDSEPKAKGLLVYSGEIHSDVKDYWMNTLESEIRDRIDLARKTRKQLKRYGRL